MIKLLKGDFARLFRSRIFWLGVLAMFSLASLVVYTRWSDSRRFPDYYNPPDGVLLVGAVYIGIVIAVFTGIFIGADYSGGTIRNKHIMGHSRAAMYLSNLIICSAVSVIMHLIFIAVLVGAAYAGMIRRFEMPAGRIAEMTLISIFPVLSITAVMLFLCMLVTSRSAAVVCAMILSLGMLIAASTIQYSLLAKEYIEPDYKIVVTEDGSEKEIFQEPVKNPRYLTGTKRKLAELFHDILPVSQIMQIADGESEKNAAFFLYSLGIIAAATSAGMLIFGRKDLK